MEAFPAHGPGDAAKWYRYAVLNLFITAVIGALMRFAFVDELKWFNYRSFLNAHMYLGLTGWAYQALFALIVGSFVPDEHRRKKYRRLFLLNQALIILIAIDAIFVQSTIVNNLLMICFSIPVFCFIYFLFSDLKSKAGEAGAVHSFLKLALIFLGVSFIGVYITVPALMASGTKKILLYYIGSQFFLHFQYNGWLTFAVFSLFLAFARANGLLTENTRLRMLPPVLAAGVLLTFFLSLFWGDQENYFLLAVASLGGFLQAGIILFNRKHLAGLFTAALRLMNRKIRMLLLISCSCFLLKLVMQCIIVYPPMAELAFTIRNYVVAYLHLVFLGFISMFLFAYAFYKDYIRLSKLLHFGIISVAAGFVFVELLLLVQGTMLWLEKGFITSYYAIIFFATLFLPVGLFIIGCASFIRKSIAVSTRQKLLWWAALTLAANTVAQRGAALFKKDGAVCHSAGKGKQEDPG